MSSLLMISPLLPMSSSLPPKVRSQYNALPAQAPPPHLSSPVQASPSSHFSVLSLCTHASATQESFVQGLLSSQPSLQPAPEPASVGVVSLPATLVPSAAREASPATEPPASVPVVTGLSAAELSAAELSPAELSAPAMSAAPAVSSGPWAAGWVS